MESYWLKNSNLNKFENVLDKDIKTDVCIIGAGMLGITCGYYLTKEGYKVTIIERDEVASKVTGHTTAKITSQHGLIYHYLAKNFSVDFARKYYEANEEAINNIEQIVNENNIDCDFERQSTYIYTTKKEELEKLSEEYDSLKMLDINANYKNNIELPIKIEGAIEFLNQAQFNPTKYIESLANKIIKNNGEIYTNTLCQDIKKDGNVYEVFTKYNKIQAKHVIIASQYPSINAPGFYFSKMYQASSYVIGFETQSKLFNGMYINVENPTFSFRTVKDNDRKLVLLGGAGHKTGEDVNYESTYGVLEQYAKTLYPDANILYKWSTRDCITLDKIAYIGQFSKLMPNVYIGTGFNKWGMTTSNIAANIIKDKIMGNENKFEEIFESTRVEPIKNKGEMKNMIVDTTKTIVGDRIKKEYLELDDIKNNDGGIIQIDGEKVGVYKDNQGKVYAVKPVCTHLGCMLKWNNADKTWDCPCHGSRFNYDGKSMYNPAIKDLSKVDITCG